MNWNPNCRKTRRLLALSAGNDSEERDLAGAERHLAVCPACREAWQGLCQSQQVLEQVVAAPVADPRLVASERPAGSVWPPPSIWPAVSRHLRTIDAQATAPNWRGWLPSAALAAACVSVVMMAIPDSPSGPNTARRRDLPVTFPKLFVGGFDPGSLSHLPITRFPDADRDDAEGFGGRFPQPLPSREEPRSF
jgi:hypothetical protein